MGAQFDPYSEWLGIPADLRPITHYEILGIARFAADGEEIKRAAAGRIATLQLHLSGPQSGVAIQLLSQVETARACLSNEATRKQYEQLVRAKTAAAPPPRPAAAAAPTPPPPPRPATVAAAPPPIAPPPIPKLEGGVDWAVMEQLAAAEATSPATGRRSQLSQKRNAAPELYQMIIIGAFFVLFVGIGAAVAGSVGHNAAVAVANAVWKGEPEEEVSERVRSSRYNCGYCKKRIADGEEVWHRFPGYENAGDWPFHNICFDLVQERARNSSRFASTDATSVRFFAVFVGGALGAALLTIYFFSR